MTIRHDRRAAAGVGCVLLAFALLYAGFIARTVFTYHDRVVGTLFDDALISMRYAHNLAAGHGLVWNPGENPRVEGYSNLGWTLVMSVVLLTSSKTVAPIAVSAIGVAVLLSCGLVARRILQVVGSEPAVQLAGMVLVLGYYPVVFWTLRGMEVGLVALLLLAVVATALQLVDARPNDVRQSMMRLSLIAGAAFLVRNDSIVLFGAVMAFVLRDREPRRQAVAAVVPLAVCMLLQMAFRYAYYGEIVPNTYILKMTGVPLGVRLLTGLNFFAQALGPLAWMAAVIAGVGASGDAPTRLRRLCGLALALAAVQSCYLVRAGGDAWAFDHSNRFIATVVPVLLVAVAAAASESLRVFDRVRSSVLFVVGNIAFLEAVLLFPILDPESKWVMLLGWAVALALFGIGKTASGLSSQRRTTLCAAGTLVATLFISSGHAWIRWAALGARSAADDAGFARLGLAFGDRLAPDTVIASAWLGAPAYYSGLQAIDLLGKTDKYVARLPGTLPFRPGHNKMDLAHSVGTLRPDVVILDDPEVASYGYVRLPNRIYVKRGASSLAETLARDW